MLRMKGNHTFGPDSKRKVNDRHTNEQFRPIRACKVNRSVASKRPEHAAPGQRSNAAKQLNN